jgi:hypothetical protein
MHAWVWGSRVRPLPQPPKSEAVMLGTEIDGVPAFTGAGLWKDPAAWHCDQAQIDIAKTRKLMQRIIGEPDIRVCQLYHFGTKGQTPTWL